MSGRVNRQILLKSRPSGPPSTANFEMVERPIPEPGEGEVLMRTLYLSLDPYMRGRMNDAKSYAKPAELGQPMVGGTVGEVVKSRNSNFAVAAKEGDFLRDTSQWVRSGQLKYREDVVPGLDKAPEAFLGLLQGKNFGKLLVKVA